MLLFLFILILSDRGYFICIIFPSFSFFISINALCWDIDFKKKIISEVYVSINSRRVNGMNSYSLKFIIIREGTATDTRYTL